MASERVRWATKTQAFLKEIGMKMTAKQVREIDNQVHHLTRINELSKTWKAEARHGG